MFIAEGVGATREGATIAVKVRILDDRHTPPKLVRDQVFKGATLQAIRADITTALTAMRDAEDDVALNAQVAGRQLGKV